MTDVQETSLRNEGVVSYGIHLSPAWAGYYRSFVFRARNIVNVSATDCGGTQILNSADLSSLPHLHKNMTEVVRCVIFSETINLHRKRNPEYSPEIISRSIQLVITVVFLIVSVKVTLYVLNTILRHFKIRNDCLTERNYDTFYIISR